MTRTHADLSHALRTGAAELAEASEHGDFHGVPLDTMLQLRLFLALALESADLHQDLTGRPRQTALQKFTPWMARAVGRGVVR